MIGPFNVYSVIHFLTVLISGGLAIYAWRRRSVPGARQLAWVMIAGAASALSLALESAATTIPSKVFWAKWQYLGMNSAPVFFYLFARAYSQIERPLARWKVVLLWAIPALTCLLAATNEWHRLLWTDFTPDPTNSRILIYHHGPWFYVAVAYIYLIVALGAWIILRTALRLPRPYRPQAIALIAGATILLMTGIIYIAGLGTIPSWTVFSIGFLFTGLAFTPGIFRSRLLDLAPVARDLLFESMSDGVIVIDLQNRIVDINPAAQRLFGVTETVIGKNVGAALGIPPDLTERFRDVMDGQAEVVRGTEAPQYLDMRISPLRDRRNRFTGRLIVLRDITELKRAEQALAQSNLELQARNTELDAYAQTVAHDLKSPLALIAGYTWLLTDSESTLSPEEQRQCLNLISEHLSRMRDIVDGLLLLASARQMQVQITPLDMAAIVAEAQKRLAREIRERHAEIILPESWPRALGYALWIEEVWVNYLSNALKYGGKPDAVPPIPPRIELSAVRQANGYIRFNVRDNGYGIAPEDRARVFVPFTRLSGNSREGYGLGLSIVQRIIERLGGEVGVESVVGEGSTFYFTLPAADPPDDTVDESADRREHEKSLHGVVR